MVLGPPESPLWIRGRKHTVEFGHIETVANVVTRMTIPSRAAQPGSLAN